MTFVLPNLEISNLISGNPEVSYRASVRLASGDAAWTSSAVLAFSTPTLTVTALPAGVTLGRIDSVELAVDDRVLIKDLGASGAANDAGYFGIYSVTGGTTTSATLVRADDLADGDAAVTIFTAVREGTAFAGSTWMEMANVIVASDGTADQVWKCIAPGSGTAVAALPISSGGTGTTSYTPNRIVYTTAGGFTTTTAPIVTQLLDTNSVSAIDISATASAINQLTIANAAIGTAPSISASGTDTNIGLTLAAKGTGVVQINTGSDVVLATPAAGTKPVLKIQDLNGGEYVGFQAADTTTTYTLTMPPTVGANNTFLQTNSSGILSWAVAGGIRKLIYTISALEIAVSNTTFTTVGYFPWLASLYETGGTSQLSSGTLNFETTVATRTLNVRVGYTTFGEVLASTNIATSSFSELALTLPTGGTNRRLQIQVNRSGGGGANPSIFGMYFSFTMA